MGKDYFNKRKNLPYKVREILNQFDSEENDYSNCENLVNELNQIEWTCDYGLDAIPYNLRKI